MWMKKDEKQLLISYIQTDPIEIHGQLVCCIANTLLKHTYRLIGDICVDTHSIQVKISMKIWTEVQIKEIQRSPSLYNLTGCSNFNLPPVNLPSSIPSSLQVLYLRHITQIRKLVIYQFRNKCKLVINKDFTT